MKNTYRHRDTHSHTQESYKNTKLKAIVYMQRTFKVKQTSTNKIKNTKMLLQNIYEIKNLQRCHWVRFVLDLLLSMGPALKSGVYPQWDLLERTNFLFISGCQVETTCGLDMGACVHFSQCWETCVAPLIRHRPVRALCMLTYLFEFICVLVLLCLEVLVSMVSFIPSISYDLSPSSSSGLPEP